MNNINQAKKIGDGISSSSEIASTISSTVTSSLNAALTGSIQDAIDASLAGFSGGSGDLSAYQSTTPTITTTAVDPVERSTITVIISDYNAANEYTIDVTDGTTTRTNGSISWELPFVPGVPVTHTISVGAIEPGMLVSVAAELSVDVQDEEYGASYINYSDTNFDTFTLTNATIKTDGDILASSAGAIAESPVYTQDTELGDYIEIISGYINKKVKNSLVSSSANEFIAFNSEVTTTDTVGVVSGTGSTNGLIQNLALTGGVVSQGAAYDISLTYGKDTITSTDKVTTAQVHSFTFTADGLGYYELYQAEFINSNMAQYVSRWTLTEAFNVSSRTTRTDVELGAKWGMESYIYFTNIEVNATGTVLYAMRGNSINYATVVTASDISTVTAGTPSSASIPNSTVGTNGNCEAFAISNGGSVIHIVPENRKTSVARFTMATPYNFANAVFQEETNYSAGLPVGTTIAGIDFNSTGTKMYFATNYGNANVIEYTPTAAYGNAGVATGNTFSFAYISTAMYPRDLHMGNGRDMILNNGNTTYSFAVAPELITVDTTSVTAGGTPTGVFKIDGSGDETYIKFEGGGYSQLVEDEYYCSTVASDLTLKRTYTTILTAPADSRTIQTKVILSNAGDELEYISLYSKYVAFNSSVDTPVISSPIDTATDVGLSPLIQGSTYNGTEAHASSDWQIATDAGFTTVVYEALASTDLESHTVGTPLEIGTTYYVRVRYNSSNIVSSWSDVISFDTVNVSINTPSFSAPSNNASGVLEGMTFTISAYSGTDTFVSSVIEIASDSGFSNIIDTITTNSQLTNIIYMNPSETTTYFARVKYVGAVLDSSWSTMLTYTTGAFINENVYTTPGTFTWVCPIGVTSVSALVIGGGGGGLNVAGVSGGVSGGGGGGGLGYKNNITVVPGQSYTVVVGAGASHTSVGSPSENGGQSSFNGTYIATGGNGGTTSVGGAGGTHSGCDGGGNGGTGAATGRVERWQGGGGAAGYSGNGGNGGEGVDAPTAGIGGGAGGGWSYSGGGVGIFGQGANGAAATNDGATGFGGSGGENGDNGTGAGNYGGGGGGNSVSGGSGAVRIIWGVGRLFPSNAA